MPLDDVWNSFQRTVEIFWKGHFDDVSPGSGVYAWFYPLRITSYDFDEFMEEVRRVHLYDARSGQEPTASGRERVGWSTVDWKLRFGDPPLPSNDAIRATWDSIASDERSFNNLRRVLLRASLLMPPLYVGKAVSLRTRCSNHLSGTSDFAMRYEKRAAEVALSARRIRDLLFVTIKTEDVGLHEEASEALVEEILKRVARPAYGLT